MHERDAIFRERLIAVMTALNGGGARDPAMRRRIGTYARNITREAGVRNWAELKQRADAATYDSLLRLFERESVQLSAAGDTTGVSAIEALALSLVARRQRQADLLPGIGFLDRFIDTCAGAMRPSAKVVTTTRPGPR